MGGLLPFYVLSVQSVLVKGGVKIKIRLSRTSTGLVEHLLRDDLAGKGMDVKVRCLKRISGAYSEIIASSLVPKECIKRVSKMLDERIIVKFKKKTKELKGGKR